MDYSSEEASLALLQITEFQLFITLDVVKQ